MLEQIYNFFNTEMLYLWVNIGVLPFWLLIIIVSVSIFGLLIFIFVRNYLKNKINHLVKEEKKNSK